VFSLVAVAVAVALGLGLWLTVGGSSGSNGTSGSTPPSASNQQARAQFQQCMQQHGAAPPSGPPGQGQRPTLDAKTLQALQACRQYLPQRPQGGFNG
jgi:hypothetical protein